MPKVSASGRPDTQRASRLSRDLIVDLATARAALRKAQALARKLGKAQAGETTARLAGELTVHIETANKALSRAGRPKPALRSPARHRRSGC
jgi:hypothetical protein